VGPPLLTVYIYLWCASVGPPLLTLTLPLPLPLPLLLPTVYISLYHVSTVAAVCSQPKSESQEP